MVVLSGTLEFITGLEIDIEEFVIGLTGSVQEITINGIIIKKRSRMYN